MEQFPSIVASVFQSFGSLWPYLLITIPLAVTVQVSGISKHIKSIFNKRPLISILLATVVGAFSPFCSCGVIPLIASLLMGGVPLGPVMSFWIASPSMDPELIPLSIASLGWNLSIWRLSASLLISLIAGYSTHYAVQKRWFGGEILKVSKNDPLIQNAYKVSFPVKLAKSLKTGWSNISSYFKTNPQWIGKAKSIHGTEMSCCVSDKLIIPKAFTVGAGDDNCNSYQTENIMEDSMGNKIIHETWKSTTLIVKFMTLAFLITALIKHYLPQEFLNGFLSSDGWYSVIIATLVGIPTYTSNMMAMPLIGGLLELGMNPGAALAFLLAGPVTTIPAMIAVWGIVKFRVFILYLVFSVAGAIFTGLLYNLVLHKFFL